MLQGIKNIVFDLGGVLIDLDKEACVSRFEELGYSNIRNVLNNFRQEGEFALLEDGKIDNATFFDMVRQHLTQPASDYEIEEAFRRFLVGIPMFKLDLLRRLRTQYNVYMLSNTNALHIEYMRREVFTVQGLTIDDYFDKLYLSYEMHCSKPNPLIFEMLIEDGIHPSNTLFLDDSQSNIESAAQLGFKTYLAKQHDTFDTLF